MSASTADKVTDTRNGARPNSARATGTRAAGGTSLACDSLAGWPDTTKSKVHFVTYRLDTNSEVVAGTQLDCTGIVTGNTINNFTIIDGTDTGNSVNDVVEMLPTAAWGQDLADALNKQHDRQGNHTAINNTGGLISDTLTVSGVSTLAGTVLNGSLTGTGLAGQVQTYANAGSAGGTGYYVNLSGLKLCWGITGTLSTTGAAPQFTGYVINFPAAFFSTIQSATASPNATPGGSQYMSIGSSAAATTSSWSIYILMQSSGSNGNSAASWFVIGT